jgi:hypothetical protein
MSIEHRHHRLSRSADDAVDLAVPGVPGKSTVTSRYLLRARDGNGVAAGAEQAVERAAGSSGAPLPGELRERFEGSLGADLSDVRLHTGAESAEAAASVGARAYAVGQDVHFAAGAYDPSSSAGQFLIAHEVAHTVQQRGAAPRRQHKLAVSSAGDTAEVEADRAAEAMVAGAAAWVTTGRLTLARLTDEEVAAAGNQVGGNEAHDAKVAVIMGHTTTADQNEARAIIDRIAAAEALVTKHPKALVRADGGLGPMKGILAENHDAKFTLEQYLATVSESGDNLSEYAASYATTKREHGELVGIYSTLQAAGALPTAAAASALSQQSKDPEFVRARGEFEKARGQLVNDQQKINQAKTTLDVSKSDLTAKLFEIQRQVAGAKATKKQAELDRVRASIDETVGTIMKVGKIAATAITGMLALGAGGIDMSKMVESSPQIAPGQAAPTHPMGAPDVGKFCVPGSDLNPNPPDTTSYAMPSQAIDTAKGLGAKALDLAGGPDAILKSALTALEQAKIDRLQGEIEAAKEDEALAGAAATAAALKTKQLAYKAGLEKLVDNLKNLTAHKQQLDAAMAQMAAAAKKKGAGPELTGALRLVAAGDKFLSQVELTLRLGGEQQKAGVDARARRHAINEGAAGGAQGPNQLHYWTVAKDKGVDDFVATKNRVTLAASGKDSLVGDAAANSSQFDVGKSLEELRQWKADVTAKRDQAQAALGMGPAAAQSG